jgi:hypothetical protein
MVKIPSALKWMLSRRARLKGERDRLVSRLPEPVSTIGKETAQAERRLSSCKRRLAIAEVHGPGRLEALDADIAAIDAAIAMYGACSSQPVDVRFKRLTVNSPSMSATTMRPSSAATPRSTTSSSPSAMPASRIDQPSTFMTKVLLGSRRGLSG